MGLENIAGLPNRQPLGACDQCGFPRIRQAKEVICPRCDTQTKEKSGLVNMADDPGHNAMITGQMPKNLGGVKYDPTLVPANVKASVRPIQSAQERTDDPVVGMRVSDKVGYYIDRAMAEFDNLKLSDFKDLKDAKKVTAFKKKLSNIKIDIQSSIG